MGKGIIHTDATKIKCAYLYAHHGCISRVARETKLKRQTIQSWTKDSTVFNDAVVKARQEISDELLAQNLEAARLSGEQLQDRIVNGDPKLTKDGIVRVPMAGRDLAVVNGIQIDKGRTSMGLATAIKGDTSSTKSILKFLEQIGASYHEQSKRVVAIQGASTDDPGEGKSRD